MDRAIEAGTCQKLAEAVGAVGLVDASNQGAVRTMCSRLGCIMPHRGKEDEAYTSVDGADRAGGSRRILSSLG